MPNEGLARTVHFEPDKGSSSVEIAPGITLELPAVAEFGGVDLDGGEHSVKMVLRMTPDGVRPTSVEVDGIGNAVTGTTLRSLRVWELAKEAIHLGLDRSGGLATRLSAERAEHLRAIGPKRETLEWVAFFYNLGRAVGLPPARQVEIELNVPRTTASKWVRRAREEGLIHGEHPEA
jgi:hypothetical protein